MSTKTKTELNPTDELIESTERMVTWLLELTCEQIDKYAKELVENPEHFFEWNVDSAWAENIIRRELSTMSRHVETVREETSNDKHAIALRICQVAMYWGEKQAERRLESSTAANRHVRFVAENRAYTNLCSKFSSVFKFAKATFPDAWETYTERLHHAVTRGY